MISVLLQRTAKIDVAFFVIIKDAAIYEAVVKDANRSNR
jgi:hypothetical protein